MLYYLGFVKIKVMNHIKLLLTLLICCCISLRFANAQETVYPGNLSERNDGRNHSELISALRQYYGEIYHPDSLSIEHIGVDKARQNALEAIEKYPNQVNDVLFTCGEYESPIFLAMCCNDTELVRALLQAGAIPCAFRASDENILSRAKKVVEHKLGMRLNQEIIRMIYVEQNRIFILDACLKNR